MQNWLWVQRESVRAGSWVETCFSLSLSLSFCLIPTLFLSQAFSNDDFICLPLEGRGAAGLAWASGPAALKYQHCNSCFLHLFYSCQPSFNYLALNMHKWNNLRMSRIQKNTALNSVLIIIKKKFFLIPSNLSNGYRWISDRWGVADGLNVGIVISGMRLNLRAHLWWTSL